MYDVVIVGAGPAGLACGIEAKKEGLRFLILDKGSVADSIRRFPTNLTFFSTPELLEIGEVPFVVSTFRPTRSDAMRYYQRVAREYSLPVKSIHHVTRLWKKDGGFLVDSEQEEILTKNVVISTGYYDNPQPYDVAGSKLSKVRRYYSEPYEFLGREVAIVGGKNSAVELALDLFRHGAHVTLLHRGDRLSEGVKYWILPDIENRIQSGEIEAYFGTRVIEIREHSLVLSGMENKEIPNEDLFVMIGYQPDNRLLESIGAKIDHESLAPKHNPGTMETSVSGAFVAGSIAAGKHNNKIFIENGRSHGRLILNAIVKK